MFSDHTTKSILSFLQKYDDKCGGTLYSTVVFKKCVHVSSHL